jgi:thiamine biosynthesis lipoprotein
MKKPSFPSFPRKRESSQKTLSRAAGPNQGVVCCAGYLFRWIPACAGMTVCWGLRAVGLSAFLLLAACGHKEPPTYQEQGYVFGTLVEVSVYGEEDAKARQAVAMVMQEFQRLHDMLHAWKPSELSELNAAIAQGKSKQITPEMAAILKDAARLSAQSDGLFNPAIGGLIHAWGFQADDFKAVLPDEKEVARLVAAKPGMDDLVFSSARSPSPSDETTSHSTKPASGQVAGYPAHAGIQLSNAPRSGQ